VVRLNEVRAGELAVDLPASTDAAIYVIGRIRTPWTERLQTRATVPVLAARVALQPQRSECA
jgi:hypothetical protein